MARKSDTGRSSSVNVSLRLDPKTKYLIDLLARDQKRTITGVIEWALERASEQVDIDTGKGSGNDSFSEALNWLWSTDEATRLVKLAIYQPSLLDYDEMRLWETIKATDGFFSVHVSDSILRNFDFDYVDMALIQSNWEELIEHVTKNRNARSIVPYDLKGKKAKKIDFPFDDEVPF